MKSTSWTSAALALLVVLALYCAGYAGSPAIAQYETTPQEQYGAPSAGTTSPSQYQYEAPPAGDQNGGGDTLGGETTAPAGGGEDRESGLPKQRPSGAGGLSAYLWDGFSTEALGLFAALALITTGLFFLERRQDRPGR